MHGGLGGSEVDDHTLAYVAFCNVDGKPSGDCARPIGCLVVSLGVFEILPVSCTL